LQKEIEGGARKILVNLADVTQIDSCGVSALVSNFVTTRRWAERSISFIRLATSLRCSN